MSVRPCGLVDIPLPRDPGQDSRSCEFGCSLVARVCQLTTWPGPSALGGRGLTHSARCAFSLA
eukprot:466445-Pyramimonas_sp.AAC.1